MELARIRFESSRMQEFFLGQCLKTTVPDKHCEKTLSQNGFVSERRFLQGDLTQREPECVGFC